MSNALGIAAVTAVLKDILFTTGDIVEHGEEAEDEADEVADAEAKKKK